MNPFRSLFRSIRRADEVDRRDPPRPLCTRTIDMPLARPPGHRRARRYRARVAADRLSVRTTPRTKPRSPDAATLARAVRLVHEKPTDRLVSSILLGLATGAAYADRMIHLLGRRGFKHRRVVATVRGLVDRGVLRASEEAKTKRMIVGLKPRDAASKASAASSEAEASPC